jgi:hypothetical protein
MVQGVHFLREGMIMMGFAPITFRSGARKEKRYWCGAWTGFQDRRKGSREHKLAVISGK